MPVDNSASCKAGVVAFFLAGAYGFIQTSVTNLLSVPGSIGFAARGFAQGDLSSMPYGSCNASFGPMNTSLNDVISDDQGGSRITTVQSTEAANYVITIDGKNRISGPSVVWDAIPQQNIALREGVTAAHLGPVEWPAEVSQWHYADGNLVKAPNIPLGGEAWYSVNVTNDAAPGFSRSFFDPVNPSASHIDASHNTSVVPMPVSVDISGDLACIAYPGYVSCLLYPSSLNIMPNGTGVDNANLVMRYQDEMGHWQVARCSPADAGYHWFVPMASQNDFFNTTMMMLSLNGVPLPLNFVHAVVNGSIFLTSIQAWLNGVDTSSSGFALATLTNTGFGIVGIGVGALVWQMATGDCCLSRTYPYRSGYAIAAVSFSVMAIAAVPILQAMDNPPLPNMLSDNSTLYAYVPGNTHSIDSLQSYLPGLSGFGCVLGQDLPWVVAVVAEVIGWMRIGIYTKDTKKLYGYSGVAPAMIAMAIAKSIASSPGVMGWCAVAAQTFVAIFVELLFAMHVVQRSISPDTTYRESQCCSGIWRCRQRRAQEEGAPYHTVGESSVPVSPPGEQRADIPVAHAVIGDGGADDVNLPVAIPVP